MTRRRALVIGGGGMIGSHLCQALLSRNTDVTATTRGNSKPARLVHAADAIKIAQLDITNPGQCLDVVREHRPQVVYNLASTTFNPAPKNFGDHLSVNVVGMCNILEALKEFPDAKLIFSGSAAAYGSGANLSESCFDRPENQLGVSKACASMLIRASKKIYNTRTIELRLFTPFGPFEAPHRLIPAVIISAITQRPLDLSEGQQKRDYIYIDDVIEALVASSEKDIKSGTVLNISSGQSRSIRTVANTVQEIMNVEIPLRWGKLPIRPDEIWDLSGPSKLASSSINWTPAVSFRDGLEATIDWYRTNLDLALSLRTM